MEANDTFLYQSSYLDENDPHKSDEDQLSLSTPVMNYESSLPEKSIKQETNTNEINQINTQICTQPKEIKELILPRIVNIVSSVSLECRLDLKSICLRISNSKYDPKKINIVILRKKEPKTTALIFPNGKMVVVGAKDEGESKTAAKSFAKDIKRLGYDVKFKNFKIENVVGTCDIKSKISLSKLSLYFQKKIAKNFNYEPEVFPGLIYHMQEPKICLLIFESGKIVFVGAKERKQIFDAAYKILPLLKKYQKNKVSNP